LNVLYDIIKTQEGQAKNRSAKEGWLHRSKFLIQKAEIFQGRGKKEISWFCDFFWCIVVWKFPWS